ncbi:Hypothetical predicted protein [Olea europaea subsp. europaea]|uniref:LysM domain-containing protein n=1 Tax=Olea europaea subsp. europaea TaxID=158383 RepID=A0A8S0TJE1_OLEEU|nr:Hypothetical predicted protein [Olea europaea subsp. europaea]
MAKASNNIAMDLNMIFIVSLLLVFVMAESRSLLGSIVRGNSPPVCDEVVDVKSGDTCFVVAKTFNLTAEFFDAINPNLNCTALFVGQWLCIDGSVLN